MSFIKKRSENTYVYLDAETAITKKTEANTILETYQDSITPIENLVITIPHQDTLTKAQSESYKDWIDNIQKDLDINETAAI